MTVSTTRSSPGTRPEAPRRLRAWLAAAVLAACCGVALAEGIALRSAALQATDDGYQLDATFDIQLSPAVLEALNRGLPLYFISEFELTRQRWYWFDEVVARRELQYKLFYNALTRQYRLASGALYQNFDSLEEAMLVLSSIRGRQVAEKDVLTKGEEYTAGVRLRLDVSQLPKPFQVSALTSREWDLSSDWARWKVAP